MGHSIELLKELIEKRKLILSGQVFYFYRIIFIVKINFNKNSLEICCTLKASIEIFDYLLDNGAEITDPDSVG